MRLLLILATLSAASVVVRADTFLYVSKAPEQQIQVLKLQAEGGGKLRPVETIKVDGSPGALAVDPQRKLLFASLRTTSKLAGFRIDSAKGTLQQVSAVALPKGENAAFVGTDHTGRWLLSASYAAGKTLSHEIRDDGAIAEKPTAVVKTVMTAHAAVFDPDNRFVFVPHVAPNAIYQYRFDVKTGKLEDAGTAAGGADKAGPRHLAFHPKLRMAYSSDETGNSITAYRFDPDKGLAPVQTLSTLPSSFKGKNTTAEVKVHPSGKFVWVSNRGHDSLAGFAIDGEGKLAPLGQTPTEKTPRSFAIDPAGRYVFAAGEGNGTLAVYAVDEKGGLTQRCTYDLGKSLTWVLAVQTGS